MEVSSAAARTRRSFLTIQPPNAPGSDRDPRRQGQMVCGRKDSAFFDVAVECAAAHGADPSTLVRAARDFCGKEPQFSATVAMLAISSLLAGGGYDPSVSEVDDAVKHLLAASRQIGSVEWASRELGRLGERRCAPGRERFQHAIHPSRPGALASCRSSV